MEIKPLRDHPPCNAHGGRAIANADRLPIEKPEYPRLAHSLKADGQQLAVPKQWNHFAGRRPLDFQPTLPERRVRDDAPRRSTAATVKDLAGLSRLEEGDRCLKRPVRLLHALKSNSPHVRS